MKKVSVIMPCFNMENYVKACLDSVLNQTLRDIEIICIDDGSTDSTADIIKSYQKKDNRITLYSQNNSGPGTARNEGLKIATGEFVCFIDSDDFYPEPDILEIIYNKAIEQNVLICGGSFSEYNSDGTVTTEFHGDKAKYTFDDDMLIFYRDYQFDYGFHRFLFNRKFLLDNKILFPSYRRYEDPIFLVKAMSIAGKFFALKKIVYAYRNGNINKVKWNQQNLGDLLKGVNECLIYSNAYELAELHAISVKRLTYYFSTLFMNNKENWPDNISELVNMIYKVINKNYLKNADYDNFIEVEKKLLQEKKYFLESDTEVKKKNELNFKALCPSVHTVMDSIPSEIKVSVIIPVYKVEKYLGTCIASVVDQTLKEIEILCVDDGTPDRSCEIVEKYMEKDPRIHLIHKENGGLSSARNEGMKVAKGDYVLFLDSDDYLELNSLEILYNRCIKDNLDFCDYNARPFFETEMDKENNKGYLSYYKRNADYPDVYTGMKLFVNMQKNKDVKPSACLHMISRKFYENNNLRFYEGIIHEDNEFTYNMFKKAKRVGYVKNVFYNRRVHGDSIMTVAKSSKNVYGLFVTYAEMLKDILNKNIEESDCEMLKEWMRSIGFNIFNTYRNLENKNMDYYFASNYELKALFNAFFVEMNYRFENEKKKLEKEINISKNLSQNKSESTSIFSTLQHTARVDIKNNGTETNDIEFISKSFSENIKEAPWMKNQTGKGYFIQTSSEVNDLKIKCIGDGELLITLLGPEYKNSKGEREAIRIGYCSFKIDGKDIFSDLHMVWHNEPYYYKQKVKDEQVISVHIEWVCETEGEKLLIEQKNKEIQNLKNEIYLKDKEIESLKSLKAV